MEKIRAAHFNWDEHSAVVNPEELYIYTKGDIVELQNLEMRAEYNGLHGCIESFMPSRQRYVVLNLRHPTDDSVVVPKQVNVLVANLKLISRHRCEGIYINWQSYLNEYNNNIYDIQI